MFRVNIRRQVGVAALGLAALAAGSLALAPAASAAQNNGVSGTVYSDGSWYTSNVDRHVTTPNDMMSAFTTALPGGGLVWRILQTNNITQVGYTQYFSQNNHGQVFANNVASGLVFHNSTRENNAYSYPYNWDAQEYY